jgi:hypothetical protein
MALLKIETTALLIREAGLDFEAFRVEKASFIGTWHVCDQVDRLFAILSPPSQSQYRAVALLGEEGLRHNKHLSRFHMREGLLEGEPVVCPAQGVCFRGPQNVVPIPMVDNALQIDTVKFSIAEQYNARRIRNHASNSLNQFEVPLFAEMSLFLFLNQPGDGQRPLFVDDGDNERHTATPHHSPINQQDQGVMGQCSQDLLSEREEVDLVTHICVSQPAIETFDLTLRFSVGIHVASRVSRDFTSNLRQLNASGSDDSANQASESAQMTRLIAAVFGGWTKILERKSDCPERFLPSVMPISFVGLGVLVCICHKGLKKSRIKCVPGEKLPNISGTAVTGFHMASRKGLSANQPAKQSVR